MRSPVCPTDTINVCHRSGSPLVRVEKTRTSDVASNDIGLCQFHMWQLEHIPLKTEHRSLDVISLARAERSRPRVADPEGNQIRHELWLVTRFGQTRGECATSIFFDALRRSCCRSGCRRGRNLPLRPSTGGGARSSDVQCRAGGTRTVRLVSRYPARLGKNVLRGRRSVKKRAVDKVREREWRRGASYQV